MKENGLRILASGGLIMVNNHFTMNAVNYLFQNIGFIGFIMTVLINLISFIGAILFIYYIIKFLKFS